MNLDALTFVPEWIVQDIIILLLALVTVIFIIKKEKHSVPILLEFVCFIFLYAGIYENLATIMGWYDFGRSLVMIGNVPVTVPIAEYLAVYTAIRLAQSMKIPVWTIPIFVGTFGVLFDFTLDPLAISQVHNTAEGLIGRWSWYPATEDITIFGVPVYNFSGWFIINGFSAVTILLGRKWFEKSGFKKSVGYLYPPLALIGSLLLLVSPLSSLMLWFYPAFVKGGVNEYVMLALSFVAFIAVMIIWKGRMRRKMSFREDYPIFLVFGVCHISNVLFAVIGGHYKIIPLQIAFTVVQLLIIWFIYRQSFKVDPAVKTTKWPE